MPLQVILPAKRGISANHLLIERFDAPDDFSDRDQDVKLHALGVNFSYKF